MAVTGLLLVGFVLGHMAGNLLVFKGPEALNGYGAFLKSSALVLWTVRLGLLAAVGLHVWAALTLIRLNQASRPVAYAKRVPQASTRSARLMRVGGILLLVFIVFHLLHFTTGTIHPGYTFSHTDVYGNVVSSFQVPWVALFYIVAMVALLAAPDPRHLELLPDAGRGVIPATIPPGASSRPSWRSSCRWGSSRSRRPFSGGCCGEHRARSRTCRPVRWPRSGTGTSST